MQLTSDGHKPCLEVVEASFCADIDFAMLVEHEGDAPGAGYAATPAMAAGVRATVWELADMVMVLEVREAEKDR